MKRIVLTFLAVLAMLPAFAKNNGPAELTVMSFNIRNGEADDGTNSWIFRKEAVVAMINDQNPDIFGVQEAYDYQVKYINEFCPQFKSFGIGREDGKHEGEHMSIFFNKKNIKVIKWGTFWLSDTPEKPSMGWDAACFRTATWALMKDKRSGKKFYFVNTHLDHVGVDARRNGLALIMDRIKSINPEGFPMVITGDFNMRIDHPSMVDIKARMQNAREVAFKTDQIASFNSWGRRAYSAGPRNPSGQDANAPRPQLPQPQVNPSIDYIWFSNFSSCTEFETITKPYLNFNYVSDHYPVKAHLIF